MSLFNDEKDYEDWLKIWSKVIRDLTDQQINNALNETVSVSKFPPSPAQFREYALGIIPPDQAWVGIGQNSIAGQAYESIDSWFRKNASEKEVRVEFIAVYKNLCEKLLRGGK